MTDPLNIEEGRALVQEAPDAPWYIDGPTVPFGIYSKPEWDSGETAYLAEARGNVANLIVWMRNNLSALLDAAEENVRLKEANARLHKNKWNTRYRCADCNCPTCEHQAARLDDAAEERDRLRERLAERERDA